MLPRVHVLRVRKRERRAQRRKGAVQAPVDVVRVRPPREVAEAALRGRRLGPHAVRLVEPA